jgi:Mrp family chromosome partitioning ATPase
VSVYDALQRARQGSSDAAPLRQPVTHDFEREPGAVAPAARAPSSAAPGPLATPLAPLLAAIRPLFDTKRGVVLHIVSATAGEGASTIAGEFAMLAGTTGHRRTLLIDADRHNPQSARAFGCNTHEGLIEAQWGGRNDFGDAPVAGTTLSAACLIGDRGPAVIDAESVRRLYDRLREQYELIVIDCPPVGTDGYASLLPEAADGVILVVQAEKTRPAVVALAKERVQQAGGQVLGAVLNRRTNYIPDFLYKLL